MKKSMLLTLLSFAFLFGCKKDQPLNQNELIIGKWWDLPGTTESYTNGSLKSTDILPSTPGAYIEFKSNGAVQFYGYPYISNYNHEYKLKGDTIIFDNVSKAKINILTTTKLSYSYKAINSATQFEITTYNFKK